MLKNEYPALALEWLWQTGRYIDAEEYMKDCKKFEED